MTNTWSVSLKSREKKMVSKYVRLNSKRIAVLIVLLMAMVAQSFAMAQTPTPEVEIIGTV